MKWDEALDVVVSRTRHERFRWLASDANPDHVPWRARIIEMAGGPEREYPPLMEQAGNFARAMVGFVASGLKTVDAEEKTRRLAICRGNECGQYDAMQGRCRKCGCVANLKARIASSKCPLDFW